ncbi:hypothetical protein ACPUVO_13295 [Pseudocolwellia sp. HL-MZ19]|uniref:hypothetical protein n=1 Tax=Pseudocolwellia sp. HL-MZ19 TaxID=3400846 RepID=UPI003CE8839C
MNNILRLLLLVGLSMFVINFIFSSIFNYFYQTESQLIQQKASSFLEQAKKNQESYLEAKYQNSNNMLKQQLEIERQIKFQIQNPEPTYHNKTNEKLKQERLRQEIYEQVRNEKLEERRINQAHLEELDRRKKVLQRADRAHIRNENMKSCIYWTQEYR